MFELSVALKYLIPRKKQLSVSLITTLSVAVISLVVWLVLLFLSVTEGIEKNWLQKLTSFNAPLRINPTNAYLNSYYYKVDAFSSASNYEHKTLAQKAASLRTDPYSAESDPELPAYLAPKQLGIDGAPVDPVKTAYKILQQISGVVFQDYELSGAMMKLQLNRPESGLITQRGGDVQTHLTQASYLSSFSD
ncbi:MAG TPA: ABC transporter permease, partial [Rhabdochlamydiaceae bacterium]